MQEGQSLQSIGKYQVSGVLGRGSMGVVYKAVDPEIGREVAIKTLRRITSSHFHDADAALERFKNEARSAGQLRHPNIITVFDVNVEGDVPYIVMDYVKGDSLDIILSRRGRLDLPTTLHYLKQIADGLDAAHASGVIHRDIKPSNLLVDPGSRLYILDFGVAKINESFSDAEKVVRPEPVMGTPGYMSPEQILNEKLDARSDLFSFAIVAFECLTGRRPFPGENFTEIVGNILKGKPLSLCELAPEMPLALEAELEKALSRKREQRFSTAAELVAALSRAGGETATSRRVDENMLLATETGTVRPRKLSEWKSLSGTGAATQPASQLKKTPNVPYESPKKNIRERKGTGEWGLLRRQEVRNLDNYSVMNAPRVAAPMDPGQVFSDGDRLYGPLGTPNVKKKKSSPFRILTGVFATACIVIAGMIIWSLAGGAAPPAPPVPTGGGVTTPAGPGTGGDPTTVALSPIDSISEEDVAPVPKGKLISEMTDTEVLGVLVSSDSPEAMVLRALREARMRKLPKILEATVKVLDNDSYVVRIETIKLVGELGDRRIVPKLVTKLDDHDAVVRRYAAQVLGKLGSRKSLAYLSSRYLKEPNAEVKKEIRSSIEKINGFPMEAGIDPISEAAAKIKQKEDSEKKP